jgi:hypothetical protein
MDRLKNPSRGRPRSFSAEADRRLRSFLRGFGAEDAAVLKELARRLGRMAPGAHQPEIDAAAGLWFADLFGWPENAGAKALAAGRVAWLSIGAARRWPLALFADAPPVALAEALRRRLPPLPPAMLGDAMAPAELARTRVPAEAVKPLRARTA